jgi:hypothetical protein
MMAALGWCCVSQQAVYMTPQLFDELGGFDTAFRISGDYDFYCKALDTAPWSRVPVTLACFRRHGTNLSMSGSERQIHEYGLVMERHAPSSPVRRVLEGQALRVYLNARNPTWAVRKRLAPLRRPSSTTESSTQ